MLLALIGSFAYGGGKSRDKIGRTCCISTSKSRVLCMRSVSRHIAFFADGVYTSAKYIDPSKPDTRLAAVDTHRRVCRMALHCGSANGEQHDGRAKYPRATRATAARAFMLHTNVPSNVSPADSKLPRRTRRPKLTEHRPAMGWLPQNVTGQRRALLATGSTSNHTNGNCT